MILSTGLIIDLDLTLPSQNNALDGFSVAVKDLFHIEGLPTSAGNPCWLKTHEIPTETSSSIKKLLENGAKVIGKSLTDELAYSLNGVNTHYGTPLNHSAPTRIPGGSSSGSAVAVAGGFADVGIGTDTGGSVRVPASYNGLFGLRPTHGVIPMDNMVPLAVSFDTVGWVTRDIDTLSSVANVLIDRQTQHPTDSLPKHCRVLKPEIAGRTTWSAEMDDWLKANQSVFKSIEFVSFEPDFYAKASEAFRVLQGIEIWQQHGMWIESTQPVFSEDIQRRFDWCRTITSAEVSKATEVRQSVIDVMDKCLPDEQSVMVLPTTPGAAPLLNASAEFMDEYRIQLMGLTALAGLSSRPQLHLPVLKDQDAPWGLSLLGAKHADLMLIDLAQKIMHL